MKKLLGLALAALFAGSLVVTSVGCGGDAGKATKAEEKKSTEEKKSIEEKK